ncbi:uncharacterized protein LOC123314945 [Coccinella septempunctata]|uniref:uncharacterized protein LOC123314945 n=1 Tax=Coccinella septempunctata TaxID=41139 RepID=UPI001D06EBEB|nr:uncharacterized protein LOC123314945 [Coccinella septempunctata]
MQKPRVLVLGGCGFIGRNLVSYLVKENLTSAIRIVDKVPPQVAWLNKIHQDYLNNPIVEFRSANLINPESCKNAFASDAAWDFVVNCAGETKGSQTDPIYYEGILKLSLNCSKEAAQAKVKHYVELSCGNMNSSEKVPLKEDGPTEPWTNVAKFKAMVEKELREVPDLRFTVLRLPIVYGSSDRGSIVQRIMVAGIYRKLGETMKLLWNSGIKLNTVHVEDVCRAIWFVLNRDDTIGEIYNVVDTANSTQGSISELLEELFDIKIDYYGTVLSAMVDLANAADEANDKHLDPWAKACRQDDIQNTPLSPHMDAEVLLNKHLNLDGAKLKNLGFELKFPNPSAQLFKNIIDEYVEMKVYPVSLAP